MNSYNTWKENLTTDNWVCFPLRGLHVPVYGRVSEMQDDNGDSYYVREFMYGDRLVDEYDLDMILKKTVRVPEDIFKKNENINIFDLPAA